MTVFFWFLSLAWNQFKISIHCARVAFAFLTGFSTDFQVDGMLIFTDSAWAISEPVSWKKSAYNAHWKWINSKNMYTFSFSVERHHLSLVQGPIAFAQLPCVLGSIAQSIAPFSNAPTIYSSSAKLLSPSNHSSSASEMDCPAFNSVVSFTFLSWTWLWSVDKPFF